MDHKHLFEVISFDNYVGKTHLDYGCGNGDFLNLLQKKFPARKFFGFDIDSDSISLAKSNFSNKISFETSLNESTYFDSVSMILSLHEIRAFRKALDWIYSHLNDGGTLIIYDFCKSSEENYRACYAKKSRRYSFKHFYNHHNRWSTSDLKKLIEKSGFKTEVTKRDDSIFQIYVARK